MGTTKHMLTLQGWHFSKKRKYFCGGHIRVFFHTHGNYGNFLQKDGTPYQNNHRGQMQTIPVMVGKKREEYTPHEPTLRRSALSSERETI